MLRWLIGDEVADFQPGQTLADRFEVVGTLGRGGTATVYLAQDQVRDERVAIKVLHDHLAHDPAMRRRLRREVQAATLVRHEAALVAHELHTVGDTLALSMPYHGGTTLTERVRSQGPLDADEVRALGIRVASVLADAHRRGVLHRDVTPNNVMLRGADDAVLTDFGLARTHDGTATATSVMGTPGYAAPEVYSGQRTDPRSDLYSLGAVLYFAASGHSPFGSGPPATILHAQLADQRVPLATARPGLPSDLVQTIEALLEGRAVHRPPGAQEVARALQAERPVILPEVPDTWNPADEPLLPDAGTDLAITAVEPPTGHWQVVVRGRRHCDAQMLANNVGRVLDLPPGALEVTRPMRTRNQRFRLMRATDRGTAEVLAEAARSAGYRARLYDVSPANPLQQLLRLVPVLIPILWVAFPFITVEVLGPQLAIVASVAATLLLSVFAGTFGKPQPDADLAVALPGELSRYVVPVDRQSDEDDLDAFIDRLGLPGFLREIAHGVATDGDVRDFARRMRRSFAGSNRSRARPVGAARSAMSGPSRSEHPPETRAEIEAEPSRAEDLRGRALGNLDLLLESLPEARDLPDIARNDLRRTATTLRDRAVDLSRTAIALEAALAATPEPADVSWVHGRLTRLETLERAGEPVDIEERGRLRAALDSSESAAAARDELESRLTSTLAQLLEIGAVATRTRSDLLARQDVPSTARLLSEQLEQQVDAVDAARKELGQRRLRSVEARSKAGVPE